MWLFPLIVIICLASVANACGKMPVCNRDKNSCSKLGEEREISCIFPISKQPNAFKLHLIINGLPCDDNNTLEFSVTAGPEYNFENLSSSGSKGMDVSIKPGCETNFKTKIYLDLLSSDIVMTTKFNVTAEINRPIEFKCYSDIPVYSIRQTSDTCTERLIIPEPSEIDVHIPSFPSIDESYSIADVAWKEPNGTDNDSFPPLQYIVILNPVSGGPHTKIMTNNTRTRILLPLPIINEVDNKYTVCISADYIDGTSCPVCKQFRLVHPGSVHLPTSTVMDFTITNISHLTLKLKLPTDSLMQAEEMCFDVERNYNITRVCLNTTDFINDTVNISVTVPRNDCSSIHVYSIRIRAVSLSSSNRMWTVMPGNWSEPICAMLNPPEIQIPKFSINGSIVEFTVESPMITLAAGLCKCNSIKANFVTVNITDADDPDNVVLADDEDNGGSMRRIQMNKDFEFPQQSVQLRASSKETRLKISAKASYSDLEIPGNTTVIYITCPATCSSPTTTPSPSPSLSSSNTPSPTSTSVEHSKASSQYRNGSKMLLFILVLFFVVFTKLL